MRCIGYRLVLSLAVVAFLLSVGPAGIEAKEVRVVMRDGRVMSGEYVSESDTTITLRIANVATTLQRSEIREMTERLTPVEEYAQRRAKLADDDVDGRYQLAQWLWREGELELAEGELSDLARRAPNNERVSLLLRVVRTAIEERDRPAQPDPGDNNDGGNPSNGAEGNAGGQGELPSEMLTEEQINLIKVYEARLAEKPNVIVSRQTTEQLLEKYAEEPVITQIISTPRSRQQFMAAPGWQKLDVMFQVRARDLYGEVDFRDDPPAMKTFRTAIHRNYVLTYCGTNECHGGTEGGDFFVFNRRANDDQTVYTNFYLLHKYEDQAGYMIDRDKPELSLLVQYAMPQSLATLKHPQVKGWRPTILSERDPRYDLIVNWVGKELQRAGPEYPITYRPGGGGTAEPDEAE